MSGEIEELKKISENYMKDLQNIDKIRIIFARKMNGNWKVVIKYETPDNPDTMSMLLINWDKKEVETFREGILTY